MLLDALLQQGPSYGLLVTVDKCEVFWPSGDQTVPEFPSEIKRVYQSEGGTTLLGSPVYGKDDFIDSTLAKVVAKVLNSQSHLQDLDNPQVELHLLRSCLGSCTLNSLLRTVPPSLGSDQFVHFDKGLRRSLGVITHSSISDSAWHQATLPLKVGGLGLKEAVPTSSAAFLGSCNFSRNLVSFFLDKEASNTTDLDDITNSPYVCIPGENHARNILPKYLGSDTIPPNLTNASQRQIQSRIDSHLLSNLKEGFSLRDQARINTISTPHAGAWLKAIPNPKLGLAMLRHEHILTCRYWLGISIFPDSQQAARCPCGHVMDCFGDHVLGCGHGPLRKKCYNAISEVIWHALLVDNRDSKQEQKCGGESNNRIGDVFHPDFLEGRPAFFDVSVRNSMQPSYVYKAAIKPGAAAEAGE
ncbi:uncharacterized protein LOC134187153 [Corticium candelabrum]|uniref:uncharacterized protein LOC134187153 n=1 Tax=Corticium candelabrum TaxID=121492 RepID=UPI002E255060|nr:uncharacterized protein LOC134187153 [Corticium candelabrum]